MSSELWAAMIAAAVSLVAGGGTIWVSHRSTASTLKSAEDRQKDEFRKAMIERLYDRRMTTYPGLFNATSGFRKSRMTAAEGAMLRGHLRDALERVDQWQSTDGGLILSGDAHERLRVLRQEVRAALAAVDLEQNRAEYIDAIWMAKNNLRGALREDLGLLFTEEIARDRRPSSSG